MDPRNASIKFVPIPGDKDELAKSANDVMATLKSLIKDYNYKDAADYMNQLGIVQNAYITTVKVCDDARAAQSALTKVIENKQWDQFEAALKTAKDKFKLLHERITAHYGLGQQKVPPIPAGIKEQIPSDMYAKIENARRKVGVFKTYGDKYYKQAEEVHNGIITLSNAIVDERIKQKSAQVQPANVQPPLSSSYRAKQQASQLQATKAAQPPGGAPIPPNNPNAKK